MTSQNRRRFPAGVIALPCFALVTAMFVGDPACAAAGETAPAALVMEISGATRPPLAVHREIAPGTRIGLDPGVRLALLHYATCSIVTVTGGNVTVTAQGLDTDAAATRSAKPGPCPRVHRITLAGPGPLGGVVLSRAIGTPNPPLVVAADAVVIVAGTGDAVAVSADVIDATGKTVERALPIRAASLQLPGTLAPRRAYVIRLHFDGRSETVDVPISTSGPAGGGMLVLRLE
ncbi:MAG: hypothetical protein ABI886_10050 [Betaproteobacteria bacterium]